MALSEMQKRELIEAEIKHRLSFSTEHAVTIMLGDESDNTGEWMRIYWAYDEQRKRYVPSPNSIKMLISSGVFKEHIWGPKDVGYNIQLITDVLSERIVRKLWVPQIKDKLETYIFDKREC